MDVFEKIKNRIISHCDERKYDYRLGKGVIDYLVKDIVADFEENNGWIACSERLPEDMQKCLTTAIIHFVPDHVDEVDNYIGVELNTYSKKYGWLHNQNVIAWQPLPEPCKEGDIDG